ncbi:MAG: hypothetical protein AAGH68_08285 [Pseudomonadota bacterium]
MSELIGNAGLTGIFLIDIGVGLIFAVLTFSLIATALQEAIAGLLNYRGEHLRTGIIRLVADDGFGRQLLEHPAIRGLKGPKNLVQRVLQPLFIWTGGARDPERMPSSIPKDTFARALMESLIARKNGLEEKLYGAAHRIDAATATAETVIDNLAIDKRLRERLKQIVSQVDFTELAEGLTATVDGTIDKARRATAKAVQETIAQLETELARWFDDSMDRVTGWYVRRAKTMLFAIGFVMVAGTGFDIIGYGKQLAQDDALRSAILAEAKATASTGTVGAFSVDADTINTTALKAREKQAQDLALTEAEERAIATVEQFGADKENLTPEEAEAAAEALRGVMDALKTTANDGVITINQTFAERGVALTQPIWVIWKDLWALAQLLLSALIIGLGCTMGGQFWFDLLKSVLKVRAGASGLNTDLEKIARNLSGPAEKA